MLAEISPDAAAALTLLQGFFWLAAGVGAACGAVFGVKKLMRGDKPADTMIVGQPVHVKTAVEYATTADLKALGEEMDRRLSSMSEANAASREKIHNATRALEQRVSSMEGKLEVHADSLTRQLVHIETKLDRAIERKG